MGKLCKNGWTIKMLFGGKGGGLTHCWSKEPYISRGPDPPWEGMMDWAVDTTDLVTDVFGGVKGDQIAKRRCGHMWRKWSRRLSVSRLLYVVISSPAVCWLRQIRTVAPRFYTVRDTMTCPGLMIPGHVGLCYNPLDWTSVRPCIFFAANHGSVCLAQANCRTLASAAGYLPESYLRKGTSKGNVQVPAKHMPWHAQGRHLYPQLTQCTHS